MSNTELIRYEEMIEFQKQAIINLEDLIQDTINFGFSKKALDGLQVMLVQYQKRLERLENELKELLQNDIVSEYCRECFTVLDNLCNNITDDFYAKHNIYDLYHNLENIYYSRSCDLEDYKTVPFT